MTSKHERHIRDARTLEVKLRKAGMPYEADVIARLCRSSASSMAENRRANKEYRELKRKFDILDAVAKREGFFWKKLPPLGEQ